MRTVYLSPYHQRKVLRNSMNRLFQESFSTPRAAAYRNTIPVDVEALPDEYVLHASVPGLDPEDLKIDVLENTVTIQGEIGRGDEENEWLLHERHQGKFSRTLTFPTELDVTKADASLEYGVLSLRIPKAETARPKSIEVKTN